VIIHGACAANGSLIALRIFWESYTENFRLRISEQLIIYITPFRPFGRPDNLCSSPYGPLGETKTTDGVASTSEFGERSSQTVG
jgi:hypothetical protein